MPIRVAFEREKVRDWLHRVAHREPIGGVETTNDMIQLAGALLYMLRFWHDPQEPGFWPGQGTAENPRYTFDDADLHAALDYISGRALRTIGGVGDEDAETTVVDVTGSGLTGCRVEAIEGFAVACHPEFLRGRDAGDRWARDAATDKDLSELAEHAEAGTLEFLFCDDMHAGGEENHAVRLFKFIFSNRPDGGGSAAEFWTSVTGSRHLPCSEFAQGFASGLVRHWRDSGRAEGRRLGPSEN